MKRFSFKPLALISAVLTIPAAAQTNNASKTSMELLEAQADVKLVSVDARQLGLKFVDGTIRIVKADGSNVPVVCAKYIKLTIQELPVVDAELKLQKSEDAKNENLKEYSTQIVPKIEFSGVPAVSNLSQCIHEAGKAGLKDIANFEGDQKIEANLTHPNERAYAEWNGVILKNKAFTEFETVYAKVFCEDCNNTPEKFFTNLSNMQRNDLLKISTKISKDAEVNANAMLLDIMTAVDASTSLEDLTLARKDLKKFDNDLDLSPMKDALSDGVRKDLRLKIYQVRDQGIVDRTKLVCKDLVADASNSGQPVSSANTWTKADSYSSWASRSTTAAKAGIRNSTTASCLKFIVETEREAALTKGIPASLKVQSDRRVKQLTDPAGNPMSEITIASFDENDPLVRAAKEKSFAAVNLNSKYLVDKCGANPQNPLQYEVALLHPFMQSQCGIAADSIIKSNEHLNMLGMQIVPPIAANSIGIGGFKGGYSRNQYDPFSFNTAAVLSPSLDYTNGNAYQGINTDRRYYLLNSNGAGATTINNTAAPNTLTNAIPLRMQMT